MAKPFVAAFIQARLTSTRLPGKIIERIGGFSALELMIERLKKAKFIDQIVLLIPETPSNDELEKFIKLNFSLPYFRGSENDVLRRFSDASDLFSADYYVRLTADCPLVCPTIVDNIVNATIATKSAYGSNVFPPSFADGFDVECVSREALKWLDAKIENALWRENVTQGLRESNALPENYSFINLIDPSNSISSIRLTLDYPEDLLMFRKLADFFGTHLVDVSQFEIYEAYKQLQLSHVNMKL